MNRKKAPEADLVIIMGHQLKVMPFAMIPELISEEVPFLIINDANVQLERKNTIFMLGEIEATVK
jgi:NAD-dependent SIR2 family protein deacetylase